MHRAYDLWRELESGAGTELMTLNGLICTGEPDGGLIKGLELCYATHPLPFERLSAEETMRRWPQFHLPESHAVYYDPEGGFLYADRCLAALQNVARAHGATVYSGEPMLSHDGTIRTARRNISAKHLILTTGAWVAPELQQLGVELTIRRKALFWYRLANAVPFAPDRFPAYICSWNGHDLYGFPTLDGGTMKAAEDTGGQNLRDPEEVDRNCLPEDEEALRRFLNQTFPGEIRELAATQTCIYTLSPDKNFIIGNHPNKPGVTLASCCSGHAFKLGPALGEVILRTALDGTHPAETSFLALERFLTK